MFCHKFINGFLRVFLCVAQSTLYEIIIIIIIWTYRYFSAGFSFNYSIENTSSLHLLESCWVVRVCIQPGLEKNSRGRRPSPISSHSEISLSWSPGPRVCSMRSSARFEGGSDPCAVWRFLQHPVGRLATGIRKVNGKNIYLIMNGCVYLINTTEVFIQFIM